MIEHVYDTLAGVLYSDWPKNGNGIPIVYDRPIKIWNLGDRDIKTDGNPSITLQGDSSQPEESALGIWEVDHTINIQISAKGTKPEESERITQEASRLLFELLKERRRLWVLTQCPICRKLSLSPEHYLDAHDDIFESFADDIVSKFETEWSETHTSPPPTSELTTDRRAGLATEAFYRVYESVRLAQNVPNLPNEARDAMLYALSHRLRPVRLLYQTKLSGTASEGSAGKQLLGTGRWTWTAKELYFQGAYGPDEGITTEAWDV